MGSAIWSAVTRHSFSLRRSRFCFGKQTKLAQRLQRRMGEAATSRRSPNSWCLATHKDRDVTGMKFVPREDQFAIRLVIGVAR